MAALARAFAIWVLVCTATLCALGAIIAAVGGYGIADAIAWSLMLGGCLVVTLVGRSGDPSTQGGGVRFYAPVYVSSRAPWIWIPVGLAVAGIGVAVELLWALS